MQQNPQYLWIIKNWELMEFESGLVKLLKTIFSAKNSKIPNPILITKFKVGSKSEKNVRRADYHLEFAG